MAHLLVFNELEIENAVGGTINIAGQMELSNAEVDTAELTTIYFHPVDPDLKHLTYYMILDKDEVQKILNAPKV